MTSSSTIPNSVLVVGRGLYALQLIRAYGNAGCRSIYLATSAGLDFARGSLFLTKSFVVHKPESNHPSSIAEWSNDVQRVAFELDIELIVPAAEESMFVALLAPKWHENGLKAAVLASPFELVDTLHNKYRFQKMCEKRVRIPATELALSVEEIKRYAKSISDATKCEKIVVKPVYTRGGRSMWVINAPFTCDELKGVPVTESNPMVVQQFISGEYNEFDEWQCTNKLIQGFSTVRTSIRKPAILDWVYRFIEMVDEFSGQLGFDFMETNEGDIYALECNPRATNGVSFFACDRSLSRGFCEAQVNAAVKPKCISSIHHSPVSSPMRSATPPETPMAPILPKSPSASLFSPAVVLGDDVLEPRSDIIIASILPALSILRGNPRLFRTLKDSSPDIEWPSDPFPLFVALLKTVDLLCRSVPKLIQGSGLATLAAKATEDELVKYNEMPIKPSEGEKPRRGSSANSMSSWESESIDYKLSAMCILVTGASGFLGSKLVAKLAENPAVRVIATGRNRKAFEEAVGYAKWDNVEFITCDLSDRSAVKTLVKPVDVVIHCAAKCSPWGHLDDFVRDNVEVTRFLLEACSSPESTCSRFIHVSSPSIAFAVDQSDARLFVKETDPLPPGSKQANFYALTKMQAEQVVLDFAKQAKQKLGICTIRPRAIYGEGDRALFPRIVSRLREGRLPQIGDGNTIVDLTHVDNVVHALICAVKAPKDACEGQVYNITDCEPQKLWRVIDLICDSLEMPRPRVKVPRKLAYTIAHAMELVFSTLLTLGITEREPLLTRYAVNVLSCSQTLDCTLAKEKLGFTPIVKTEQGLKSFLDSIRTSELRLPIKRTNPRLVLYIFPFIRGVAMSMLWYSLITFVWPEIYTAFLIAALACFFVANVLTSREAGHALLKEEAQKRRARAQILAALEPNQETGEPEKGKRARPWRNPALVDIDAKFAEAVRAAPSLALNPSARSLLLDLYGLFKQQKDGDCNVDAPSMVMRPRDFAKWKAWNDRKGLSAQEARKKYINVIEEGFDLIEEGTDPEADRAADLAYVKSKEKVLYNVRIDGVGRYLPTKVVSSEEVETLCNLEPGFSKKHNVGVMNRRWADIASGETNSFMAAKAIEEACRDAGITPEKLDLIINASASNERILPDGSCLIKRALKLESSSCACFSVHATCLSFIVALDLAASLIHSGRYHKVAIVSSEISSIACNFAQPESALLLGDGAAACVLSAAPRGSKSCIHRAHFENYCKGLDAATLRTGTLKHPKDAHTKATDHLFDMDGPQIVEAVREVGVDFLEKVRPGLSVRLPYDIDLVVPHQPSGTAMDMLVAHGWPRDQIINVLGELGNCVAASVGMALYEAIRSGKLKRGNKLILCGTGGGITLGAIIMTY